MMKQRYDHLLLFTDPMKYMSQAAVDYEWRRLPWYVRLYRRLRFVFTSFKYLALGVALLLAGYYAAGWVY